MEISKYLAPAILLLWSSFAVLCEVARASDTLRFLAIGDMGGLEIEPYSTYFERCNAEEMGRIADIYGPQFVLELGDNFYWDGVDSVDDPRFNTTFEDVYTAASLQVPWYIIAGNHDHHKNVTAQILYSDVSKRWNFPDLYYYQEFSFAGGEKTFGIIFIDTVTLCGDSDDHDLGQPKMRQSLGNDSEAQWQFIEKTLNTSSADYLFIAGHYPIYSTAIHGPTQCLVDRLLPLMVKYNASGYLAGHDHNLQHLHTQESSGGVPLDFFVSGMANTVDPTWINEAAVPPGSSLFHYGDLLSLGGFMYSEVSPDNMTVTFINGAGKQLYTAVTYPRAGHRL